MTNFKKAASKKLANKNNKSSKTIVEDDEASDTTDNYSLQEIDKFISSEQELEDTLM